MDDFEKELKIGFLQEAEQLLTDTEQCFLELETNAEDASLLEKIFRLAHNLKGSSKAVGFDSMGQFTHEFESLLLKIKNKDITSTTGVLNLLLRCNDHLKQMVGALTADLEAKVDSSSLMSEIEAASRGELVEAPSEPEAEAVTEPEAEALEEAAEEIAHQEAESIPSADAFAEPPADVPAPSSNEDVGAMLAAQTSLSIEEQFLRAQQEFESKPQTSEPTPVAAPEPVATVAASTPPPVAAAAVTPTSDTAAQKKSTTPPADDSIRVSLSRLEKLLNYVGEMVILQSVLKEQSGAFQTLTLRKTVQQLGKVTKEVQDISMSLRMVPVKQTFQKMQRIVRDTAQMLNKKVNLQLQGEETELDKTVLEHLGDPLVHIIRNAVDHGIENAELRKQRGKPEQGTVNLRAFHEGGRLVIEIKDDGGGIPGEILHKKAIEKGILKPGAPYSEKEAIHLIFHPGFSTKSQVTEVSGRGVGMDVVKTNIERLSGEVQIQTKLGEGTTFRILLPLTLAIIDGMVIRTGKERFIIPLGHVHETLQASSYQLEYATGVGEVLNLRGENLVVYRLDRMVGQKSQVEDGKGIAIVVRTQERPFAVLVDDIIGQSQIVIKQLGTELAHMKGYSGSAILGDGRPALILEVAELIKKYDIKTKPEPTAPRRTA